MNQRRWTIVSLCAAALLAGTLAVTGRLPWMSTASAAEEEPDQSPLVGKTAPEVSLSTIDGKAVKLSDQKGKVVVLDFWATWCPPCRLSLPHVQELSQKKDLLEKGLAVFAVNAKEDKEDVEPFMKKNSYSFTVLMDAEGKAMDAYGVRGIPTTVVVGRDGKVKNVFVGFNPKESPKALDAAVEAALKAGK